MTRRVDRVEFIDLTTVRRTIAMTLHLAALRQTSSSRCERPADGKQLIPLGWFVPWANAGAVLLDAGGRAIPYLTHAASDEKVQRLIEARIDELGSRCSPLEKKLDALLRHRVDPGRPGNTCACCRTTAEDCGYRELMNDKWGCRLVGEMLETLHRDFHDDERARELARILLAWQTNFVLFVRLDVPTVPDDLVTLQLSFDEELMRWESPWDRRMRVLKNPRHDLKQPGEARECRRHISRGGPFYPDLDELEPRFPARMLARSPWPRLRAMGRRGLLRVQWHVAWQQASGLEASEHHVDVVLPNELAAVRMRMLRIRDGRRCATVADQVGSHATIVAPDGPVARDCACPAASDGGTCEASGTCEPPVAETPKDDPWSPTLFSLVLTQRSPSSWYGGAWIALLTGAGLLAVATWRLGEVVEHTEAGVATLLLAPTLVATALSVRAASEIADQLTTTLRWLIAAVAVLAATCAIGIVVQPEPPLGRPGRRPPLPDPQTLRIAWIVAGVLLLGVGAILLAGARCIKRMLRYGRRSAPRRIADTGYGNVLNPKRDEQCGKGRNPGPKPPRIRPPDRWLNADEGDLVPWGWLHLCDYTAKDLTHADKLFWERPERLPSRPAELVAWVRKCVGFEIPHEEPLPGPPCRCH